MKDEKITPNPQLNPSYFILHTSYFILLIIMLLLIISQTACRHDTNDTRRTQGANNTSLNTVVPQIFTASFTPQSPAGDIALTLNQVQQDVVILNVAVKSIPHFSGVAFKLSYDPVAARFIGFEPGDLFDPTGAPLYAASTINRIQGHIAVGATLKRGTAMATGPGNVIRLRFKVISKGTTDLIFSENVVRDNSFSEVSGLSWSAGQITGN